MGCGLQFFIAVQLIRFDPKGMQRQSPSGKVLDLVGLTKP